MKKKIGYYLLTFLLICSITRKAEAGFTRYQNNPVVAPEKSYEAGGLYAPAVVYKDGLYLMWYSSFQGNGRTISFATSTDGGSWEKYNDNPVIRPDTTNPFICEKGVHDPDVIWNPLLLKFQMWFIVNCEPKSTGVPRYWVKYAQSPDGIIWQIEKAPVLSPSFTWEQEGISFPSVLLDNGVYKMWYGARDSYGKWKIGYATSQDGKNWSKYADNPIVIPDKPWEVSHIGGSDVIKEGNIYTMYYHGAPIWPPVNLIYATSFDGTNWIKPSDNPIISTNQTETKLSTPDIIKDQQGYKIYYSAIINGLWQISLLANPPYVPPTPTPTPRNITIILPGLFASWNKEAILHNQLVDILQWKINPIIREYRGIINTLENLGFKENQDFYIFAYDWRKKLDDSANDLNDFISQKIPGSDKKVNLVGHSLGGLIGRIYAQKYNSQPINKLITVGSPHQGAAQAYKLVEAGEIDRENTLQWLATKMIINLNKDQFETDKQTVEKKLPIARDLFPTYNFLKKQTGDFIPISMMKIKNDTLLSYNSNFSTIFPIFQAIVGEKGNTPFGYSVKERTIVDQLLGNYPDGRPSSPLVDIGDLTVNSLSSKADSDFKILNNEHSELIYKKEAISEVLNGLGISYQESQLTAGEKTTIFPSLIFLIKSPATIKVDFQGKTYDEQEGIIFIKNAEDGDYSLKVKGVDLGRYTIVFGQITEQNDLWGKIEGQITQTPATSQTDTYVINFNSQSPRPFPVDQNNPVTLFDELTIYLSDLNKSLNSPDITKTVNNLNKAKQFYQQNNKGRLKSTLLLIHQPIIKKQLLYATEKLENLYEKSLGNYRVDINLTGLKKDLARYKKTITPTQDYLLGKQKVGKNVIKNTNILLEIEKRLNQAEGNINNNNLNLADILLKSVSELIKGVRK